MGKLLEFLINLDSPRQVFYPGEQLSGHVLMNLREPHKMRNLQVILQGIAYCSWSETRGTGDSQSTDYHTEMETLVNINIMLFSSTPDGELHPSGHHVYPFQMLLPPVLPSSFEGHRGYIRYYLKAVIDRPWKSDQMTMRPITVNEVVDVNLPQYLNGPGGDATKEVGCLCWAAGSLLLHGHLDRAAYCPGEAIVINAQIENRSQRDMAGIKAKLFQIVAYMATTSISYMPIEVSRLSMHTRILKGDIFNWVKQVFRIPALPPTILTSKVINVTYTLEVEVDVPWGFDLKLSLPLTIGSVPFLGTYGSNSAVANSPSQKILLGDSSFVHPCAPAIPPPPPQLLGYPDLAPPSYAASIGNREVSLAKNDGENLFGFHTYLPVYTYAQPYAGPVESKPVG